MRVELRNISKRYANVVANDGVSLLVVPASIHAVVGENGAGKSTLMNVLYGMTVPDEGEILVDDEPCRFRGPQDAIKRRIGMVHQDFLVVPRFTVVETITLGLRAGVGTRSLFRTDFVGASKQIRDISERFGLEVDPNATVSSLSVGEQQRVEIVKLLFRDADVLILDEPTGVLTPQEAEVFFAVLKLLKQGGKSVLVITHKLNEVLDHTDEVTVMRAGRDVMHVMTAETTPQELAQAMVGERPFVSFQREQSATRETVLKVCKIDLTDERGVQRLRSVSLNIGAGEILGIAGVDGNGQSELAEVIAGTLLPNSGEVLIGNHSLNGLSVARRRRLGMAYIPADRRAVGSINELSISLNTVLGRIFNYVGNLGFIRRRLMRVHSEELITKYEIRAPSSEFIAGNLSGGNLQKLILGRELMESPLVIVFEQPTRGLDIRATDFVRQTILNQRSRGASILLISADLDEVLMLSDRIAVMFDGEIVGEMKNENLDTRKIGLLMAGVRQ